MLGYVLQHPGRTIRAIASDPLALWETYREKRIQAREYDRPQPEYFADAEWERHLHERLGVPLPCHAVADFQERWKLAVGEIAGKGIDVGPDSFNGYNDGDGALVRAVWCLVHHLRPAYVVETGVARGLTSRFILEGLRTNNDGELFSIDLAPLDPAMKAQVGMAVGETLRERWTLLEGTSRRHLPRLLKRSAASTCSCTTAGTPKGTCASSWITPGPISGRGAPWWSTTSIPTGASNPSARRTRTIPGSCATPSRCGPTPAASTRRASSRSC